MPNRGIMMKIKKSPLIAKPITFRISKGKKISLMAGESFEQTLGGPNEEGFSYSEEIYSREGNVLFLEINTESRDCDGRYSRHQSLVCEIKDIRHCLRPNWRQEQFRQRDSSAIAMGY